MRMASRMVAPAMRNTWRRNESTRRWKDACLAPTYRMPTTCALVVVERPVAGDIVLVDDERLAGELLAVHQHLVKDLLRHPRADGPLARCGQHVGRNPQVAEKDGGRVHAGHLLDAVHQRKIVVEQVADQHRADQVAVFRDDRRHADQDQARRPFAGIKGLRGPLWACRAGGCAPARRAPPRPGRRPGSPRWLPGRGPGSGRCRQSAGWTSRCRAGRSQTGDWTTTRPATLRPRASVTTTKR